ncbi:MAG: N-acetyl-gamma-glutamyl-phosphate reductase [Syntrophales bacterium]|nr:N-acetyl-gamma-glutamyl-phosphate reductase [Syntrophales bacterium]
MRLLIPRSDIEVTAVTSRKYKDVKVSKVYPHLEKITNHVFADALPEKIASLCDIVFLAVPHGEAMRAVPVFLDAGKKVIDLSADYRLKNVDIYEKWYVKHTSPNLISEAVYGLPELYRENIRNARLVANPGCYPTSIILGLAPLLTRGLVEPASIIADSKSGVSGAGRELQMSSLFCEVNEGFKAYKAGSHRHTPEIEQEVGILAGKDVSVLFTPHLIPIDRGILSTIYGTLQKRLTTAEIVNYYHEFYESEPFIRVCEEGVLPNVASVRGSNMCDIGIKVDERTGRVIVISAIDNLIKGAAGQAIQNMNLICGIPENSGLHLMPLFP